jgi:hypothetical protein
MKVMATANTCSITMNPAMEHRQPKVAIKEMTSTEMNHILILHHARASVKRKCVVGDVSGKSLFDLADVVGGDLDTEIVTLESFGDGQGGPGAGEGIEDKVAWVAGHLDNPFQDGLGHLARVLEAFAKGATDAGGEPGVGVGLESSGILLGTQDP